MSFALSLKSTLDKLVFDLATDNSLAYVDLDGAYLSPDVMESTASALAWSLTTFSGNPQPPLYRLEFHVGGKTSDDPAQYKSLDIVSLITDLFAPDSYFDILDYSGEGTPTIKLGQLHVTSSESLPAQFDKVSGLRLVRVNAQVVAW